MSRAVLIKIKDENELKMQEFQFNSSRQYRLLCFDRKGHPQTFGRLPLKIVAKSSKSWVENWASKQDINEIKNALREHCSEVSPETLLESTKDSLPIKLGMKNDYGEKTGAVVFALLWPMFTALIRRLTQAVMKPVTTWQFARTPGEGIGSILGWLFRRQNGNGS